MDEINGNKAAVRSSNLFPVVGIGASAGGLDAFKRLLKAIPEHSGTAYILVQHLDPSHESILPDLLQRVTKIPVLEITDNVEVRPDHIYIIPSNQLLNATDGILKLTPRLPRQHRNMPIDLFFASLAEVHQSHAIGVVLSGTGTDGTGGLKAIKDNGGVTFAQAAESASYDAMPQNAIDAGVVDFVLAPEDIPGQLLLLNDYKTPAIAEDPGDSQEESFRQILSLLRSRRGVDFTYYKPTTVRRRISRRVALSMQGSLAQYLDYLGDNIQEQDILYQDLLIPVTQFFRDPKVFDALCETIFPILLKERAANDPIRVWIAGCSTGEEAYSIAMCLHEYLAEKSHNVNIQLFATDISDIAIVRARTGIYKENELTGLSQVRIQQFFTKTDGMYRLNKSVRDACVFAYHNFLKDPPFAKMDLISCRNSLIYLEPFLQKKALTTFHYALKPNGYLVLGKSETTGQSTDLFSPFDKNNKIYARKDVKGKFLHVLTDRKENDYRGNTGKQESVKDDYQRNADEVLLHNYAPPGVVVNSELDIVQFRGATGLWLEQSSGKPNLNILKMAREGLAFELRNALHKAKNSREPVVKEDIPIQFMGSERTLTLEVFPLLNTIEPHYLVLFRDMQPAEETPAAVGRGKQKTGTDPSKNWEQERIKALQKELAQTRDDMRSITEDQEASNEELQSANEELLSGSEELQSLNEELETSREEILTTNEELIVVNQELYDRNDQLTISRLYSEAIVSTIREPIIILGNDLHVKSANKAFYTNFHTSEEGTEGKLLFDLGNKQWDIPALREMLERIFPEKSSIKDYEVSHNFPGLGERVMLLNAQRILRDNNEEQLILLAIEDITEKRKVDKELKLFSAGLEKLVEDRTSLLHDANEDLRHSNENLAQFAYVASHDLQEPLRKIRTFSSLLQEKYKTELPEGATELITRIRSSSERMSTLIKEVLNFSKVLHGETLFEETNLDDILSKILVDFDLLISENHAIIYREPLPVIEAIPLQISQLFYNLVGNALKFCCKDVAPHITISSRVLSPEEVAADHNIDPRRAYCEIRIQDNGIGFQQEYADQIFLIFHRLHGREQFSGTGIGLALCKKIVINHHGEIYATSRENEGALFRIILPFTQ